MARKAQSKSILSQYRKVRASYLRKVSRTKKQYGGFKDYKPIKIPKFVTEGSIRKILAESAKISKGKKSGTYGPKSIPKMDKDPQDEAPDRKSILIDKLERMIDEALSYRDSNSAYEEMVKAHGGFLWSSIEDAGWHSAQEQEIMLDNLEKAETVIFRDMEKYIYESGGVQNGYLGDVTLLRSIISRLTEVISQDIDVSLKKQWASMDSGWEDAEGEVYD